MAQRSATMTLLELVSKFVLNWESCIAIPILIVLAGLTMQRVNSTKDSAKGEPKKAIWGWKKLFESETVYVIWIGLTIFLIRAPTWSMGEANIDESQWLAGVITLRKHFAFWGTVDGGSSGPLIIHGLLLWGTLVGEDSFEAAKVFTTANWILICLLSYATLRQFSPLPLARVFVSPFVACVSLHRINDYVGYNGEQLSILLLAWAVFHIACLASHERKETLHALFFGIALGLLPYAKLQTVPIGLIIAFWGLTVIRTRRGIATFLCSVLAIQVCSLSSLIISDHLTDFWMTSILGSLDFSTKSTQMRYLVRFYFFLTAWLEISDGRTFLIACVGVIVISVALRPGRFLHGSRALIVGSLAYLAISAFCVAHPGTFYLHYYLLLFHPVLLAMAVWGSDSYDHLEISKRIIFQKLIFITLFASSAIPGVWNACSEGTHSKMMATVVTKSRTSEKITSLADEKTTLAVWGWQPRIYVETRLPQATPASCTAGEMLPGKYQEYFLSQYVNALKKAKNLILVDTTGNGCSYMFREEIYDHSNYQLLHEFVSEELEYLVTVEGNRIFRRRTFAK